MTAKVNITAIILKGEETCTLPAILEFAEPIVGVYTLRNLLTLIAGVVTILTLIFSLGNAARHLTNYSRPFEQRQIVRIVLTPFVFSTFNFFSLWFYNVANYLQPIADLYEVFALVAIFLLFLAYVCPDPNDCESFFLGLERRSNRKQQKKHDGGSLRWFYVIWTAVFLILPVRFGTTIASWIIAAIQCPLDPARKSEKVIVEVIGTVFLIICMVSIIRFYRRLRPELKDRGAMGKLITFKLIVGIVILQPLIFSILLEGGVLKPSKQVSLMDWEVGLPAFMVCCEMFIFSIAFLFPFGAQPYISQSDPETGRKDTTMGFWSALLHSLNIWDVLRGVFQFVKLFRSERGMATQRQQARPARPGVSLPMGQLKARYTELESRRSQSSERS